MAYSVHNFQDGQVLTGAAMDDIDQAVKQHDDDIDTLKTKVEKLRTIETGTVSLTNTQVYPYNNSKKTVALTTKQDNTEYEVVTEVTDFTGNVGEIVISDKKTNGFAAAFTGSATAVTVKYKVIGGYSE